MESILNINNGIKELTQYYNCNIRILDVYVKVRESLYYDTILNQIDTKLILHGIYLSSLWFDSWLR